MAKTFYIVDDHELLRIGTISFIEKKSDWIDFDAARLLDEPSDKVRDALLELICDICSGKKQTKNEINGYREIAIFKDGVTL